MSGQPGRGLNRGTGRCGHGGDVFAATHASGQGIGAARQQADVLTQNPLLGQRASDALERRQGGGDDLVDANHEILALTHVDDLALGPLAQGSHGLNQLGRQGGVDRLAIAQVSVLADGRNLDDAGPDLAHGDVQRLAVLTRLLIGLDPAVDGGAGIFGAKLLNDLFADVGERRRAAGRDRRNLGDDEADGGLNRGGYFVRCQAEHGGGDGGVTQRAARRVRIV